MKSFTRSDGSYGPNYPGTEDERRKTNSERLSELFMDFERTGWIPAVLIAQTWTGFVDPKVLAEGFKNDLLSTFYQKSTLGGKRKGWL